LAAPLGVRRHSGHRVAVVIGLGSTCANCAGDLDETLQCTLRFSTARRPPPTSVTTGVALRCCCCGVAGPTGRREKGDSEREQPVSPTLVALVEHHVDGRGSDRADEPVFRTRTGVPMSTRRYSTIFDHARSCLDWADRTPVSAHVLRHTAITAVGRLAGYPVAQAFAGHAPPSVTGRYLHASLAEVAAAIATLTGEAHPLAADQRRFSGTVGSSACGRR